MNDDGDVYRLMLRRFGDGMQLLAVFGIFAVLVIVFLNHDNINGLVKDAEYNKEKWLEQKGINRDVRESIDDHSRRIDLIEATIPVLQNHSNDDMLKGLP